MVTLSLGHKSYFTFKYKGPAYDYESLDQLEICLYARLNIDVQNELDFFKSHRI